MTGDEWMEGFKEAGGREGIVTRGRCRDAIAGERGELEESVSADRGKLGLPKPDLEQLLLLLPSPSTHAQHAREREVSKRREEVGGESEVMA